MKSEMLRTATLEDFFSHYMPFAARVNDKLALAQERLQREKVLDSQGTWIIPHARETERYKFLENASAVLEKLALEQNWERSCQLIQRPNEFTRSSMPGSNFKVDAFFVTKDHSLAKDEPVAFGQVAVILQYKNLDKEKQRVEVCDCNA